LKAVSGSDDMSIIIWDVDSGTQIFKLIGHKEGVRSVIFSSDGKQVVSCSYDGSIIVWDVINGNQIK
jgi:WD40 repeat protein